MKRLEEIFSLLIKLIFLALLVLTMHEHSKKITILENKVLQLEYTLGKSNADLKNSIDLLQITHQDVYSIIGLSGEYMLAGISGVKPISEILDACPEQFLITRHDDIVHTELSKSPH